MANTPPKTMCQNTRCENQPELDHEHRHGAWVAPGVAGPACAAVVVDRHVEVFARRPDRLVLGRSRAAGGPESGGTPGSRIPPKRSCSRAHSISVHRVVDVVEEDLRHARAAARACRRRSRPTSGCAPGARPSAARTRRRPAGVASRFPDGKNGGIGVGEEHLGDDAVVLELAAASRRWSPSCGTRTRGCGGRRTGSRSVAAHASNSSWYFASR